MPKTPPVVFRKAFEDQTDAENAWTLLEAKGYDFDEAAGEQAKVKLRATTGEPQNRTSSDKNQ